jgi:indole-3-glycerol phosphate synthase
VAHTGNCSFERETILADILAEICTVKLREIAAAKSTRPERELVAALADSPPVRDFAAALRAAKSVGLIAEVKKASPSAGLIRADFHPVEIASIYADAGATCLSCLTDESFFQGHLEFLTEIRQHVSLPVMRKDFLLDRYQILEARVAGADCVLLIAECLNDCQMRDLYFYASELGMDSLIEIYDPDNLDRVLKLEPELLGINNRNLKTMVTDLSRTTELAPRIPESCLLIGESGIRTRADVERLASAGVRGILVGETLMRQDDIAAKIRELLGTDV